MPELERRPAKVKSAFEKGLLIAVVLVIYTMVLYLLDLHMIQWLGFAGFVIMFALLFKFGRDYARSGGTSSLSYGQAFGYLLLMVIFSALLGGVFNFVYFEWIAPETIDKAIEEAYEGMMKSGMGEEQVMKQMEMSVQWMTSTTFTIGGIVTSFFWGLIASLVIAAMIKVEPTSY